MINIMDKALSLKYHEALISLNCAPGGKFVFYYPGDGKIEEATATIDAKGGLRIYHQQKAGDYTFTREDYGKRVVILRNMIPFCETEGIGEKEKVFVAFLRSGTTNLATVKCLPKKGTALHDYEVTYLNGHQDVYPGSSYGKSFIFARPSK